MGFFDIFSDIFQPSQKNVTSTGTNSVQPNPNYQPYTGPLLPNLSDLSQLASDRTYARAFYGGKALPSANTYNTDVTNGKYLGGNPYNDAMFGNASRAVADKFRYATDPGIQGAMSKYGRLNSGSQRQTQSLARKDLGDTLNGLAANIYGTDYANERGRMDAAAQRAPLLNAADYEDANQAAKLGQYFNSFYDLQTQRQREDWKNNQTLPYTYGASSSNSNTTPYFGPSPFETGIGIASKFIPFLL